ncbi:hypothetical protein [Rickettsiella endosymbiont of Aleochara curtula]|uniref:hypothetical protein n=1 Tax=Rickettsiella endosymbiont of Aleochara curtula TaxID=3077936 RepID=UPI00313E7326
MHLNYLDQMIPKRWVLLLRYWLPFFKSPSDFYFKSRDFIDNLKHSGYHNFPWKKLPDLVFIFEKYAFNKSETNLSKKITNMIFTKKSQLITTSLIEQLFERFNPDNTRTPILNDVLQRLPTKFYIEYFSKLNVNSCSSKNLKWCARLKDKFRLEDKLILILSLSDEVLIANQATLFTLAIQECEEKLLTQRFGINNFLNAYVIEQLLAFIFERNPKLIFSRIFVHTLINQLLKNQNPILTSHLLELDEYARYSFFETFLTDSPNFQQNSQYFLSLCPEEQRLNLIDQLIISVFNTNQSEMDDEPIKEHKSTADNLDLLLLAQLEEQHDTYPINLFQLLATLSLTKKPLDLEKLKKFFEAGRDSLEYRKNFSIACQSAVAEYAIHAIKILIKDNIMIYVHKENTRNDIHRAFYQFFNNEYIGKPLNVAKLILKKLPPDLQSKYAADLDFLQQLLIRLYQIQEDPSIVEYKNKCFLLWNKSQREYEEKTEARRELLQRIRSGKQSSVAYQRMDELFGSEAATMQAKWKHALGVHFFDATNKEECKTALHEAAEIIKFNRVCNDYSCLSTSPSSASYFAL